MGSISTITDEEKLYDELYAIAVAEIKTATGFDIRFKDDRTALVDIPSSYAYLDQVHGAYVKRTLQPSIYDVEVEFLCEINVTHDKITEGRLLSKQIQRAFHRKASSHSYIVNGAMATDAVTASGHLFVVSMNLIYTTSMV